MNEFPRAFRAQPSRLQEEQLERLAIQFDPKVFEKQEWFQRIVDKMKLRMNQDHGVLLEDKMDKFNFIAVADISIETMKELTQAGIDPGDAAQIVHSAIEKIMQDS